VEVEADGMKRRYSLYVHYLEDTTNHPDKIQSSDNFQELLNDWHHKNCDSEEFHRLNPNAFTTRIDFGIASNLGAY
jgi:hypothetical protein